MGIVKHFSTGSTSSDTYTTSPASDNVPIPVNTVIIDRFEVLRVAAFEHHTLVWLSYENCENFEGKKILLFAGQKDIHNSQSIDPHFTGDNDLMARFEPTESGWLKALVFVNAME